MGSVTREKAPIYTLSSSDVRAFSRNERGIASSLIWINFDRHGLLSLVHKMRGTYIANVDGRCRVCNLLPLSWGSRQLWALPGAGLRRLREVVLAD